MHEHALPSPLAAQDAAEALIAIGWPVTPYGPDMDEWRIGDFVLSDDELVGLAQRRGIRPPDERLQ